LTLERISEAFRLCAGGYAVCRVYHELRREERHEDVRQRVVCLA